VLGDRLLAIRRPPFSHHHARVGRPLRPARSCVLPSTAATWASRPDRPLHRFGVPPVRGFQFQQRRRPSPDICPSSPCRQGPGDGRPDECSLCTAPPATAPTAFFHLRCCPIRRCATEKEPARSPRREALFERHVVPIFDRPTSRSCDIRTGSFLPHLPAIAKIASTTRRSIPIQCRLGVSRRSIAPPARQATFPLYRLLCGLRPGIGAILLRPRALLNRAEAAVLFQ